MQITDAQVHIFRTVPANDTVHKAFSYRQLIPLMDEARVERAVIVPPSWCIEGNDSAIEATSAHPTRFAIMGVLQLDRPENKGRVATWREQPGMLGFRQTFHSGP